MSDDRDDVASEAAFTSGSRQTTPGIVYSARQLKRVKDLLARLAGARRAVGFYPTGHPAVRDAVEGLMAVIRVFHEEGLDVPLTFFENEVMLGEQLLPEESMLFDQLIGHMADLGASSLTFTRGLTSEELERALPVLSMDEATLAGFGGLESAMQSARCPHVVVGAVQFLESDDERDQVPEDEKEAAHGSYSGALDLLRDLDRLVRADKVSSAQRVRGVAKGLVDNVLNNRWAMLELTGLRDFDEYTFFHSVNVAIHSLALGSVISRDRRFLTSLGIGALMHDIGKLSVDLRVLNKQGRLSAEEWALMRKHPEYGAEVAAALPGLDRSSLVVILEHHMRYDLDGYPQRTPARRQHLTSRITAIADAYDAMTSRRSYSNARLQDEAMSIVLKDAGTAFDPQLARLFVQAMGVYPPRAVVRLDRGDIAIVVRPTSNPLSPIVRVVADARAQLIDPYEIDLSDASQGRRIESCLDATGMNLDIDELLA